VGVCATPPAAAAAPTARQEVVTLLDTHGARAKPVLEAKRVAHVSARRPITRGRTALPVLDRSVDDDGVPVIIR